MTSLARDSEPGSLLAPCQIPGATLSVLGLVGLVSV